MPADRLDPLVHPDEAVPGAVVVGRRAATVVDDTDPDTVVEPLDADVDGDTGPAWRRMFVSDSWTMR